ncbi:alpha/beta hydrolase family esterase [Corynebacterium aquatimens]|uniref:Polyhydroxybutyrate depolymerase n=1 Tax=Corynebacterium aquatimens TaxID=1190508 RepID=A0A931GW50_9CORY|nr:alpha/beta hydrolase-fold protein [Corynebacterium aquatimens]MBG6122116.1 polyhydroxybutyrate depolymerase [Corynebacterium aquatimens]WJY65343.1 Putative esterase [Corynebacterium aquatimens]
MKISRRGIWAAMAAALLGISSMASPAHAQLSSGAGSSEADLKFFSEMSSALLDALGGGGGAGAPSVPSLPSNPFVPSQTVTKATTVWGKDRTYHIVLPAGFDRSVSYPVIFGFGGWQHNATRTRAYEKLETAAGSRAIVVYPEADASKGTPAWAGAPYSGTQISEDVQFIRNIVNDLAANYGGDRFRVYAAGLSNGGGMALALGCHAPNLVKGVAGVAGAYYNPTVSNCVGGSVKTLIMHSKQDDVVQYGGGTRHGAPYKGVPAVYYETGLRNRCNVSAAAPKRVGNTEIFQHSGCVAPTKLMKIDSTGAEYPGHTWFNNPSATYEVVNFFLN